ncbi:alpha/beta hydrolase [soil metagenome]
MKESSFEGVGGYNIFTRSWQPEGEPRGVVVISHGFNAHSGHYFWVAEQFASAGLAVYALDYRGRGRSDGERFYVNKFAEYTDDLAKFIQIAKSENAGLPVYLLGHSAGGVIACTYSLDHQSELAGLICEDFAFKLPAPDFALAVFKGLAHVFPHAHILKLKNEDFSRDPKHVDEMNNDPLIANETQPTETLAEMVRTDERLEKEFPAIKIPLLILHGTADKAAKWEGSQLFYDSAGSADKTIKLYDGGYHDLLNDIDKGTVMADIQNWIDERIPAETSASAA